MSTISRVMALGDAHANIPFMMAALNLAHQERCQVVHVVGDLSYWTHKRAGVEFLDATNAEAQALDLIVTFTDGNHENFDHLYEVPVDEDGWRRVRTHVWHAPRGLIWRWGNVNFLSMGGAHSIDGPRGPFFFKQSIGPLDEDQLRQIKDGGKLQKVLLPKGIDLGDWWPQETITDEEVEAAIKNMVQWADEYPLHPQIDVMFTHDAPTQVSIPCTTYPAAEENRARLQKVYEVAWPQLLVHGHFHRFQQYHDRHLDCLAISLAHDASKKGQYMFISTDPFEIVVPTWR